MQDGTSTKIRLCSVINFPLLIKFKDRRRRNLNHPLCCQVQEPNTSKPQATKHKFFWCTDVLVGPEKSMTPLWWWSLKRDPWHVTALRDIPWPAPALWRAVCRQHQHLTRPSIVSVIVLWMATWQQPIALSCSVLKLLLFMCCVFHESNMFIHPSHFIIVLQNRHSNVFKSFNSKSNSLFWYNSSCKIE